MFEPGQTVLCVKTTSPHGSTYHEIHVGVTYIVRDFLPNCYLLTGEPIKGEWAVHLVGICRGEFFGTELSFDSTCFMPIGDTKEPVVTKETKGINA